MFFTSHGVHGALTTSLATDNPFLIASGFILGAMPDLYPYIDRKNRANTLKSLKGLKIPKMDYSGSYTLFHKPEHKVNPFMSIIFRVLFAIIFFLHPEVDRPMHNKRTGKYFAWSKILTVLHIVLDIYLIYTFFF